MAEVKVYNMKGEETGTMELADSVFAAPVNEHLVHMAVVQYLANIRRGTQKAKTRHEVRGGGRKPWRQKGTGHARQGSIRAAQWKGGGMIFAPVPRDYSFKMNKKEKRIALMSALSDKLASGRLIVIDELSLPDFKTKGMRAVLDALPGADGTKGIKKGLLVLPFNSKRLEPDMSKVEDLQQKLDAPVNLYCKKQLKRALKDELRKSRLTEAVPMPDDQSKNIVMAARNLPNVWTITANNINTYDIVNAKELILTKAAVECLQEVYA